MKKYELIIFIIGGYKYFWKYFLWVSMSSLNLLDKLVDSDSFWTVGLDHFEENVEETPVFLLISHLSLKENGDSRNDDFLFFQDSYDRPVGSWQPSLPRFHDFAFYWGFLQDIPVQFVRV